MCTFTVPSVVKRYRLNQGMHCCGQQTSLQGLLQADVLSHVATYLELADVLKARMVSVAFREEWPKFVKELNLNMLGSLEEPLPLATLAPFKNVDTLRVKSAGPLSGQALDNLRMLLEMFNVKSLQLTNQSRLTRAAKQLLLEKLAHSCRSLSISTHPELLGSDTKALKGLFATQKWSRLRELRLEVNGQHVTGAGYTLTKFLDSLCGDILNNLEELQVTRSREIGISCGLFAQLGCALRMASATGRPNRLRKLRLGRFQSAPGDFIALMEGLRGASCPDLMELELHFPRIELVPGSNLSAVAKGLQHLPKLQKLYLDMVENLAVDALGLLDWSGGFKDLAEAVSAGHCREVTELKLWGASKIARPTMMLFLRALHEGTTPGCPKLRRLTMSQCGLDDVLVQEHIGPIMLACPHFEDLIIPGNCLGSIGLASLGLFIPACKRLRNVIIDHNTMPFTDVAIISIIQALRSNPGSPLLLDVSGNAACRISNVGLQMLIQMLILEASPRIRVLLSWPMISCFMCSPHSLVQMHQVEVGVTRHSSNIHPSKCSKIEIYHTGGPTGRVCIISHCALGQHAPTEGGPTALASGTDANGGSPSPTGCCKASAM